MATAGYQGLMAVYQVFPLQGSFRLADLPRVSPESVDSVSTNVEGRGVL